MRILIFGASGYAGSFIKQILEMRSHFVIGTYKTYRPQFSYDSHMVQYNLEDQKGLGQLLNNINPDIIISCLNGDFKEQLKAHEIMLNFLKEGNNKKIIFLSTSNVFDGSLEQVHYESDIPKAASDYGKFKIQCENIIKDVMKNQGIIIRIPEIWGKNCPRLQQIKKCIQTKKPILTYKNIFVNYTTNEQIAQWIDYIIENNLYGIFHVGTKDIYEYVDFHKEVISSLQLGEPLFHVEVFPTKLIQAVLPGRKEILLSMQRYVKDVLIDCKI